MKRRGEEERFGEESREGEESSVFSWENSQEEVRRDAEKLSLNQKEGLTHNVL